MKRKEISENLAKHILRRKPVKLLPVIIEKDEDGFYVVECPVFSGCYSQGETLDEALKNIREVIDICLEEEDNMMSSVKEF